MNWVKDLFGWKNEVEFTPEENQNMVEAFLARHPEYELDETITDCWLNMDKESNGYVQFLPFEDEMDGFFIARMVRKEDVA